MAGTDQVRTVLRGSLLPILVWAGVACFMCLLRGLTALVIAARSGSTASSSASWAARYASSSSVSAARSQAAASSSLARRMHGPGLPGA
ncbi:hypothetical protein ACH4OX_05670 [Streptomyces roseolus]|uniref:hypothetical protein n=1 Tax=Streptomyces roseolus TaxID=67358 RepID=UPI0037A9E7AA